MAELVDARDLKSLDAWHCTGSIPVPGTSKYRDYVLCIVPVFIHWFIVDADFDTGG